MWIAYSPPIAPIWSITGGAWVASDGSELSDGKPRRVTRLQWPAGAQTTGTTVALRATFPSMPMPAVGALLNVTLPPGTKVVIKARQDGSGAFTTDMAGNSATGRTILRSDGTVALVWHFAKVANWPLVDPAFDINITGIEITIYNDVAGVAAIAAEAMIDLGEVFISRADYIPVRRSIESQRVTSERRRAIDNTILRDPRYLARSRDETYAIKTEGFKGISNARDSLRTILFNAAAADRAMFVPRWHVDGLKLAASGNASESVINDSAVYGVISNPGPINIVDDVCLETSIQVSEVA